MVDLNYIEELRKRAKKSRVYSKHQSVGLEISEVLDDTKHKALYIKLAKENNSEDLLILAKSIAENKTIRNKGAYFMKVWSEENKKLRPVARKNLKNERRNSDNRK
mgnify:CR=1 FL=1